MPQSASSARRLVPVTVHRWQRWCLWMLLMLLAAGRLIAADLPLECKQCNGSELLCDRRYDQVAYATTHNSMSNRTDHWFAPIRRMGSRGNSTTAFGP